MTGLPPPGMTLVRHLGRGRLGATALCRDSAGAEVVVTALETTPTDAILRRQLESEIGAAAAAFDHPCAVTPRLLSGQGHQMYLVQPYLAGGALGSEPVPADEAVVGAVRLVAVLAQAHSAGMLHGDIRPSNVLRTADGAWMLTGGGVALAMTRAAYSVEPDPLFAAPEYFGGERPGAAADVYSLGATLYAALIGRAPHADAAPDGAGALHAARLGPAPELPLSVPAGLAALIRRMLATDPADRPALSEVDQVLRALTPAGVILPSPVPPRAAEAPPRPAVRLTVTEPTAVAAASKRRTLVAGVAIGALFVAGAVAVTATDGNDRDKASLVASEAAPSVTPFPSAGAAPPMAPDASKMSQDQAVAAGFVPDRIKVFVYRGRLSVLWRMTSHSNELTSFVVVYERRANEKAPKVISRSRLARDTYVYFLDPSVSLTTCATVRSFLVDGRELTPQALTCPSKYSELSDFDKQITKSVYKTKIESTTKQSARDT